MCYFFCSFEKFLSTTLVLWEPNWILTFHISSDASDMVIGEVLGKEEDKDP